MKTAARNGKHGRSIVLGQGNVLKFDLKEPREGFERREERKVAPCRGDEGYEQRKQADKKGENCSSRGVTE